VSHKAILLPGIVLPAQLAYPALLEALGEGVDARARGSRSTPTSARWDARR
jgi:hypothetical protein